MNINTLFGVVFYYFSIYEMSKKYFIKRVSFPISVERKVIDDNLCVKKDTYKCVKIALESIGMLMQDSYINYVSNVEEQVLVELVKYHNQIPKKGSWYYETLIALCPS